VSCFDWRGGGGHVTTSTAARGPRTWGWSDHSLSILVALLLALATGVVAGSAPGRFRLVVLAIAGTCIVGATLTDGFVGLTVGVLSAGVYVEVTRRYGAWGPGDFPLAAVTSVLMVLLGWNAGLSVGGARRAARAVRTTVEGPDAPSQQGLFAVAHGMLRLEEEIHRARSGASPLALLLVRTSVVDAGLDSAARSSAQRSVARVVVTRTRPTDVPFASGGGEVCAILPVTDPPDAWGVLSAFLEGLDEAVFTDRAHAALAPVKDFVEVETSLVFLGPGDANAAQFLDAARASLREPLTPSGAGR
jgi:hypothetical protein